MGLGDAEVSAPRPIIRPVFLRVFVSHFGFLVLRVRVRTTAPAGCGLRAAGAARAASFFVGTGKPRRWPAEDCSKLVKRVEKELESEKHWLQKENFVVSVPTSYIFTAPCFSESCAFSAL